MTAKEIKSKLYGQKQVIDIVHDKGKKINHEIEYRQFGDSILCDSYFWLYHGDSVRAFTSLEAALSAWDKC
jgi:hypothetical protein